MFGSALSRAMVSALTIAALAAVMPVQRALAQSQTVASAMPGTPAAAASADQYGGVFDDWIAKHRPKTAILVVRRNGKTVFVKGHNADPLKPTMIASLSKPITGACVGNLIRDGKLSFTTRVRDALGRFFRRYGNPIDRRLEQVTVEQLLVHRSGLVGNGDNDPLYGVMNKRASTGQGYIAAVQAVLGEYLTKLKLIRGPGQRYSYSNTGYEVLSAVIEESSGRSYEDYCREAVFGKLGIAQPKLHPDWRMLSGAGGWYMPGPDYLAFFDIFSPSHPFLSDTVKGWIDRAQTKWTPGNHDRWYGLGVNVWAGSGRWTVSHGGVLNSQGRDQVGQPTEASIVSHAYRAANGNGVFIAVNWSPDALEAVDELRREIGETHKLVTALP
jgi:CubicO group peptidase (beta-lactamase class C family)